MQDKTEHTEPHDAEFNEYATERARRALYMNAAGDWALVRDPAAVRAVARLFKRMIARDDSPAATAMEIDVIDARAFPGHEDAPGGGRPLQASDPRYYLAAAIAWDASDCIQLFVKICGTRPAPPFDEEAALDAEARGHDGALSGLLDEMGRTGILLQPAGI